MTDGENIQLVNLYVDESGTPSVGITQNRYFLLTAVILTPDQQELACLLFEKWRKKYLKNPHKSFHAADFFEDFEEDYKRADLKIAKNFATAVTELLYILYHVEFHAQVYYVDLIKLKKLLGIENAPQYKDLKEIIDKKELAEYKKKRKEFDRYFQETHSGNKDTPYILPLLETFKYHQKHFEKNEKDDKFNRKFRGFISFESLSGADIKPLAAFHRYKDKINSNKDYGDRIVGLNFQTKNSLDGGIEIADFISYISFQTLRTSHKLFDELKGISEERIKQIKRARTYIRTHCKIEESVDVTEKRLPKSKKS